MFLKFPVDSSKNKAKPGEIYKFDGVNRTVVAVTNRYVYLHTGELQNINDVNKNKIQKYPAKMFHQWARVAKSFYYQQRINTEAGDKTKLPKGKTVWL